jgi:hypothetical protein
MVPWDSDKSTAADPDNPAADEQLTADEWDSHVSEGHFPADELNLGVDNGDPVLTDPQNGDEVVLRYDRSEGTWVVDSISAEEAVIPGGTIKEAGTVDHGTVNDQSNSTTTVSFQGSYSSAPTAVLCGAGSTNGNYGFGGSNQYVSVAADDIRASQFDHKLRNQVGSTIEFDACSYIVID